MLKLAPGASEDAVSQAVIALPGVVAYLSTDSIANTMRHAFSLYDALVGLMLVFAAVMAAALLYNAMSANVGERTGELGSLQAAGMGAGLLGRLVAGENMLLVLSVLPCRSDRRNSARRLVHVHVQHAGLQMASRHAIQARHLSSRVAVLVAAVLAQIPAFRAIGRMDVAKVVRERSL